MDSRRVSLTSRIASLVFSLGFYLLSLLIVIRLGEQAGFDANALVQIAISIAALAAAALLFFLHRNPTVKGLALLAQFLIGLFLGVIAKPYIWLEPLWFIPLAVQYGHMLNLPLFVVIASGTLLVNYSDTNSVVAWGSLLEASPEWDRLISFTLCAATVLAIAAVRFLYDGLKKAEALVANLKNNILKLTRANYDFQKYAADTEELTLKRERLRISREIHDTIGYTMTTLRMMLEAGTDLISTSPLMLEVQLHKALEMLTKGHRDIRVSLRELQERESDRPRGLKGLSNLIELFSKTTGVRVLVEWGNLPWHFPAAIEEALYRFVQEGMSNALSHGNATEIRAHFRYDDGRLIALLTDDGVGADMLIEGMGLNGMRERIESCGGSFTARSLRIGFQLEAHIPMQEEQLAEDSLAHRR
jgi:signal transduction histidine kinase